MFNIIIMIYSIGIKMEKVDFNYNKLFYYLKFEIYLKNDVNFIKNFKKTNKNYII